MNAEHIPERRTDHELRQLVDRIMADQREQSSPKGVRRARMAVDHPRHQRSPIRQPNLGGTCTRKP